MEERQHESHEIPESMRSPQLDAVLLKSTSGPLQNAQLEAVLLKHQIPPEYVLDYFRTRSKWSDPLKINAGISTKLAFTLGFLTAHKRKSPESIGFGELTSLDVATLDKNLNILSGVSGSAVEWRIRS
ncbi:MAG: hypothetical protein ABH842_06250 [Candidatus Micrarchaeota archaeon]